MSDLTRASPGTRIACAFTLAAAAIAPLGVACLCALAPPPAGPVAAVFPPWWSGARAFAAAAAAGPVARIGAFGFIVIAAPAERSRLRAAGAWLLLDPRAAGACSPALPS
jgi:hypothetical protein